MVKCHCGKRATFGLKDDDKPSRCKTHCGEFMIDLKNIRCIEDGCNTRPCFGLPKDKKATYCSKHKLDGMLNISKIKATKHLCSQCSDQATMIFDRYYCNTHIPLDQLAVIKRLCKIHDMDDSLTFICKECQSNRDRKKIRVEHQIVGYLNKNIIKQPTSTDRIIGNCSKRRPDLYYDCKTHAVIVEVDEHQHKGYVDTCECARVNQIVNDLGGLPLTIIRYNPDNFRIDGKLKKVKSSDRLELLVETTKKYIETSPESFVNLVQLYYNGSSIIQKEDISNLVVI